MCYPFGMFETGDLVYVFPTMHYVDMTRKQNINAQFSGFVTYSCFKMFPIEAALERDENILHEVISMEGRTILITKGVLIKATAQNKNKHLVGQTFFLGNHALEEKYFKRRVIALGGTWHDVKDEAAPPLPKDAICIISDFAFAKNPFWARTKENEEYYAQKGFVVSQRGFEDFFRAFCKFQ